MKHKKRNVLLAVLCTVWLGILSGCAVLDVLLEEQTSTVYEGTVKRVEVNQETTTIHFEEGMSYTVPGHPYARPGVPARIVRDADGNLDVE